MSFEVRLLNREVLTNRVWMNGDAFAYALSESPGETSRGIISNITHFPHTQDDWKDSDPKWMN